MTVKAMTQLLLSLETRRKAILQEFDLEGILVILAGDQKLISFFSETIIHFGEPLTLIDCNFLFSF